MVPKSLDVWFSFFKFLLFHRSTWVTWPLCLHTVAHFWIQSIWRNWWIGAVKFGEPNVFCIGFVFVYQIAVPKIPKVKLPKSHWSARQLHDVGMTLAPQRIAKLYSKRRQRVQMTSKLLSQTQTNEAASQSAWESSHWASSGKEPQPN